VAVGLAASARSAALATEGEYDFVRLLALDAAAARDGWDLELMGLAPTMPAAVIAGDKVTVNAAADELTTTFESGAALLSPRSGNLTLTARVDVLGAENTPKARAALMLREGSAARLSPTSRHVLISVNAQGVVQFQRRDRSTNFDPGALKAGLRPPVWLRLQRYDDPSSGRTTVTGLYSTDGVSWIRLDGADFATPDPIMTGVLFSSGSTSTYANLQLSGLSVTATAPPPVGGPATDAGGGAPADGGAGQ
jgi:hypothetical protein